MKTDNFNTFFKAYLEAILFSECDMDSDNDASLHELGFDITDFSEESIERLHTIAQTFFKVAEQLLDKACQDHNYGMEKAGHDFYFTSAGHGVGYWDRNIGYLGDKLTELAGRGEYCMFINDGDKVVFDGYVNI